MKHVSKNLVFCRIVKCYLSKYIWKSLSNRNISPLSMAGLIALELSKYKLNQNYNFYKACVCRISFFILLSYDMRIMQWNLLTRYLENRKPKNSCFLCNQDKYPCMMQVFYILLKILWITFSHTLRSWSFWIL